MSNEEKEAIERLKDLIGKSKVIGDIEINKQVAFKDIEMILNLIEKQSKEIEELKEKNKPQLDCAEPVERTEEMVNMKWVNHKYISKDKIKEILGIEEDINNEKLLSLLQTIVDKNARLEDIEKYKLNIIMDLKDRIKSVDETYKRELPLIDVGEEHKVINISYLSKKEKEEVINKRNCLLVQKATYQEILSLLEKE